jgi:hypothetical protein
LIGEHIPQLLPGKFGPVVVDSPYPLSCEEEKSLPQWSQTHIAVLQYLLRSGRPSPGIKKNHDEHISAFGQGHICTRKSTIQGGTLAMQNGKNSEKRQPAKE